MRGRTPCPGGFRPNQAPRTIEELDTATTKQSAESEGWGGSGVRTLGACGLSAHGASWWSWIWPYHFGGSLYDPATDKALAASPQCIRAFEWVQSYTQKLGVDNVEKFRTGFGPYGTPQSAFLTGEVAMVVQGPWMANLIQSFKPELDYGVAPLRVTKDL